MKHPCTATESNESRLYSLALIITAVSRFFVSLANPVVNFKPISTTRSWVVLRHQYGISAQPRSQGFFSSSREAKCNPNNEVDCSRTVHVLQM